MAQAIFIGRQQEQNEFRQVLRSFQQTWVEKNLPTFSKPFRELASQTATQPQRPTIFLFYGEGGMGKTTLVKELKRIAEEEPFDAHKASPKQFQTLYLDWERHKHDPEIAVGHDQLQPDKVLTVLHREVAIQFREVKGFKDALMEMRELDQKVEAQLKQPPQAGQETLKQELLDLGAKGLAWALRTAAATQAGPVAAALGGPTTEQLARVGIALSAEGLSQLTRILNQVLTPEEQDIYTRPEDKLGAALGAGLTEIAQKKPLVIVLDTYEIVDQILCDYALRKVIQAGGGRILWVISGRANLADSEPRGQTYFRGYRQDFSEQVYPRKLGEFGPVELQQFFRQKVPRHPLDEDQASALSQFSQGIPYVINLAAEQWANGVPFEDIIAPPEDDITDKGHYKIIKATSDRFLKHCLGAEHRADQQAVYALAMMRRPEANLLRAMLAVEEIEPRLQELRQRYSFILPEGLQLDNKIKSFLGGYLQGPIKRSEPLVQELNQRALVRLGRKIKQAIQGKTDRADWLADEDTAELLLDYAYHCFWQNDDTQNQVGWKNLVTWLVEGWQYNPRWTRQLLLVAEGFSRQFSTPERTRLKHLQAGLAPQAEIEAEADLLDELEKWRGWGWLAGDGEEERQAILTLKQGRLRYRQEQYEQALHFYTTAQRQIPSRATTLTKGLSSALDDLGFQVGWKGRSSIASETAKQAFTLATELDSKNRFAWYGLGAIQNEFKLSDKAIEAYQQAIQLDPKFAAPHNGLGNVYSDQKDYDKAIEACQQAIQLDPKFAAPHNGLGIVYSDQQDYDKAIEAYQQAIQIDPKDAYPHNNLGNVYRDQQDYDKAIEAYQQAIQIDPKNAYPHNNLGIVYRDQQDYDKAIEAYQQAIQIDPKYAYPHNNLGNVYRAQQDYDKAIEAYQQAIQLDPKYAYPHNNLGNVYRDQQDYDKAIEAYQQAIQLDPKFAYPHNNLGNVYREQQDYDKAIEAYQQAIQIDPKFAAPHNSLGLVYREQQDYDKAIEAYQQAIQLDPKNAYPHNGLGLVYSDQQDYDKAIEAYQQAIQIDPKNAYPHNNLGNVYSDQKDYDKAIEAYQLALKLPDSFGTPASAHTLAHNGLGWLYLTRDQLTPAANHFQQAITINEEWGTPRCNLGIVFALQGLLPQAHDLWQQALPLYTDDDDWNNAAIALYTIALGDAPQGLADLQALVNQGALTAALENVLEDAEMLMKCPTAIEGMAEAVTLLQGACQ